MESHKIPWFQTTNQIILSIFINPIETMNFIMVLCIIQSFTQSMTQSSTWTHTDPYRTPFTGPVHPIVRCTYCLRRIRMLCSAKSTKFRPYDQSDQSDWGKNRHRSWFPYATAPGDGVRIHTSHWFQKI